MKKIDLYKKRLDVLKGNYNILTAKELATLVGCSMSTIYSLGKEYSTDRKRSKRRIYKLIVRRYFKPYRTIHQILDQVPNYDPDKRRKDYNNYFKTMGD